MRRLLTATIVGLSCLAVIAGCVGSPGPTMRPSPSPETSASPTAAASADPFAIPSVAPIPVEQAVQEGWTPAAFVLQLAGEFGTLSLPGSGACYWNWDGGSAELDGLGTDMGAVHAFGESLAVYSYGGLVIHRQVGDEPRAYYQPIGGGSVESRQSDGDVYWHVFHDLQVDATSVPEDRAPFPEFTAPLGRIAEAATLSGVVAWRCDAPSSPPPSPYLPPMPRCPGPAVVPALEHVTASIGNGTSIEATLGSGSAATCSTVGTWDVAWSEPTTPLAAHEGDQLRLTVPPGWHVVHWQVSSSVPGSDQPEVLPGFETVGAPRSIEVTLPGWPERLIYDVALVAMSDDGKVVVSTSAAVLVEID